MIVPTLLIIQEVLAAVTELGYVWLSTGLDSKRGATKHLIITRAVC